ncbi:hypothetical protein B0H14DRAFT_2587866 [Mycena olivaceomarginata]|nr:hypothetical protein B0H14DRAFT_2587866 [Mycena olivaceomarginata]
MDFLISFNPHLTIGACEIGVLISYALFGVTTVQAYIYYGRFPNDDSKLKALVTLVWCIENRVCLLVQVVSAGHTIYTVTISDFGQFFRILGPAPKSLGWLGFFTYRIYVFTKRLYIPMISWCMSFLRLLGITTVFVTELQMTSISGSVPLVDKLVMWTIAIVVMVCFVTMRDNFIWLGVYVTVPGRRVAVWAKASVEQMSTGMLVPPFNLKYHNLASEHV